MNTKQQAAEDIRKIGRMLKGFIALGDDLERLGSLENAAQEAESRFNSAKVAEEAASKDLARAIEDIDKAKASASQLVADARLLSDQTVSIGKKTAEEAVAQARKAAEQLVTDAKRLKADIDAVADQRQRQADDLAKTIDARQAKLQELETKLAEFRAKIS